MTNYSITPPPELVGQWLTEAGDLQLWTPSSLNYLATQAAQWGADQTDPTLMERALAGDATAAKQFLYEAGFTDEHGQWLPQYQPIADELEAQ